MIHSRLKYLPVLLVFAASAMADIDLQDAIKYFESFIAAQNAFSPTVTDYYSDEAKIDHIEPQPNGFIKENHLTGKQYKFILRNIRPMALSNNDVWEYLNLDYRQVEDEIHITGERRSHLRRGTFPYEAHLRQDGEGNWSIIYELLKTKPIGTD